MILYFAYGSNLDLLQMQERCPGCRPVVPGRLQGYCLAFTRWSSGWGCGVANVVPCESSEVWGLVYELSPGNLESLDRDEGYPHAYTRFQTTIAARARSIPDVWVYSVREKATFVAPSRAYLDVLRSAASAHDFPESYVRELERIPTTCSQE